MGERRGLFSPFSSSLVPAPRRRRRSASRVSTTKTRKKYPHRIHHTAPNNLPPRGRGKEKRLAISRACRETKRIGFLRQEEAAKRRHRASPCCPESFGIRVVERGRKRAGKKSIPSSFLRHLYYVRASSHGLSPSFFFTSLLLQ